MPALVLNILKNSMRVSFTSFVSHLKPFELQCELRDIRSRTRARPNYNIVPFLVENLLAPCLEMGDVFLKKDNFDRTSAPYGMVLNEETHLHGEQSSCKDNLKYLGDLESFTFSSIDQVLVGAATVYRPLYWFLFSTLGEHCFDHCLMEARRKQRIEKRKDLEVKPLLSHGIPRKVLKKMASTLHPFSIAWNTRMKIGGLRTTDDVEPMLLNLFNCVCGTGIQWTVAFHVELLEVPMNERLSNRDAAFYSKGGFGYDYNGGSHVGLDWLGEFDSFLAINGHDLEYFNCVLFQRYDGGHGIGFHSDNEELFEEGSKILTVCIQGDCEFRFRCATGETAFIWRHQNNL
uniref:ORF1 protein n=1 Tax=Garlic latent virus E29-6 TaxID=143616 RepID=Q67663_9VIRU|nr:ORF1 [Garlic latent virus E29-6]